MGKFRNAKMAIGNLWSFLRSCFPVSFGKIGKDSYVAYPRTIVGGRRVFIGDGVSIGKTAYIHAIECYRGEQFEPEISIGNSVYIGPRCYIAAAFGVRIADDCVLSEEVYLSDVAHGMVPGGGNIMNQPLTSKGEVVIGKGCFIGLRASIMPGVTLGNHCVVGSGAVVARSFPDYSMLVGNPAKLVKKFDCESGVWVRVEPEK